MSLQPTPVERFIVRLKNRPWVAGLIAIGSVVIALSTFTDAAKNLIGLMHKQSPEESRAALGHLSLNYSPEVFIDRVRQGDVTAVKLFLNSGMNPNTSDHEGFTALRWAAAEGHLPVVQALLEAKADVNHRASPGGATALLAGAYRSGNPKVLGLLIKAGADADSIKAATHAAARHGRLDALKFLLEYRPELAASRDDGDTLLIHAVQSDDVDLARVVLAHGHPVQEKGAEGLTALHVAAGRGLPEMLRLMLSSRGEVRAKSDDGMQALHFAAHEGYREVTQLLLAAGADQDARCDCPDRYGGGATPLMMAARAAKIETVRVLLDSGAAPNTASKTGWTALLLAADTCQTGAGVALVQLLLDKGAEVNSAVNGTKVTALMQAQRLPCIDVTRALLAKGANVNARDKDGWTAIMYALLTGSVDAVRILLEGGARLYPQDAMPDGTTPSRWIDKNLTGTKAKEMTQLLRRAAR
jgi:ankyrin repeat protein